MWQTSEMYSVFLVYSPAPCSFTLPFQKLVIDIERRPLDDLVLVDILPEPHDSAFSFCVEELC